MAMRHPLSAEFEDAMEVSHREGGQDGIDRRGDSGAGDAEG